ncbi:MAG: hypothetical protein DRH90_23020 [Deltaproteobacteria bacterium]|nr:MAG: hypothetical protein DRH90_23020 [Deltaproteobacteria bacterium]RLC16449.1 MAG: hypothetical protein DRI24_08390 [Deltaproteobacteria bacterium]
MGMYADVLGNEVKFSGLVGRAICNAKGIAQADNIVEINKDEVNSVLCEIESMFSAGLSLVENGNIAANRCSKISSLASFAALLVEWHCFADEDSMVFA